MSHYVFIALSLKSLEQKTLQILHALVNPFPVMTQEMTQVMVKLEVEQGRGILCVHLVQPKACRTWFKLYYFNPTMASINDTYIVLATIPSPAGLTQIPQ